MELVKRVDQRAPVKASARLVTSSFGSSCSREPAQGLALAGEMRRTVLEGLELNLSFVGSELTVGYPHRDSTGWRLEADAPIQASRKAHCCPKNATTTTALLDSKRPPTASPSCPANKLAVLTLRSQPQIDSLTVRIDGCSLMRG